MMGTIQKQELSDYQKNTYGDDPKTPAKINIDMLIEMPNPMFSLPKTPSNLIFKDL